VGNGVGVVGGAGVADAVAATGGVAEGDAVGVGVASATACKQDSEKYISPDVISNRPVEPSGILTVRSAAWGVAGILSSLGVNEGPDSSVQATRTASKGKRPGSQDPNLKRLSLHRSLILNQHRLSTTL
jgi:hypothetical protein